MSRLGADAGRAWQPRDREAEMLAQLLRLSRLTVLLGEAGSGKTTLLKYGVLPLLGRRSVDSTRKQQRQRAVIPFPDRRSARDGEHGTEVAIFVDRWDEAPLAELQNRLWSAPLLRRVRAVSPATPLAESLHAWHAQLGVRFYFIFDRFESHLAAPAEGAEVRAFTDELVRIIDDRAIPASFLFSMRDHAQPLLGRLRDRVADFDDAMVRLPPFQRVRRSTVPLAPPVQRPSLAALVASIPASVQELPRSGVRIAAERPGDAWIPGVAPPATGDLAPHIHPGIAADGDGTGSLATSGIAEPPGPNAQPHAEADIPLTADAEGVPAAAQSPARSWLGRRATTSRVVTGLSCAAAVAVIAVVALPALKPVASTNALPVAVSGPLPMAGPTASAMPDASERPAIRPASAAEVARSALLPPGAASESAQGPTISPAGTADVPTGVPVPQGAPPESARVASSIPAHPSKQDMEEPSAAAPAADKGPAMAAAVPVPPAPEPAVAPTHVAPNVAASPATSPVDSSSLAIAPSVAPALAARTSVAPAPTPPVAAALSGRSSAIEAPQPAFPAPLQPKAPPAAAPPAMVASLPGGRPPPVDDRPRIALLTGAGNTSDGTIARELAGIVSPALALELAVDNAAPHAPANPTLSIVTYDAIRPSVHGRQPGERAAGAVRVVTPLYLEEMHFIARRDSPLAFIHEMRGQRINIGPVGSANRLTAARAYERMFGSPLPVGHALARSDAAALRDLIRGNVDVVVVVQAQPVHWLAQVPPEIARSIKLLKLDPEHPSTQSAIEDYLPASIRADSYGGWLEQDAQTLATMAFMVTSGDPDAATTRHLETVVKALCSSLPALRREGHRKWREVQLGLRIEGGWKSWPPAEQWFQSCTAAQRAGVVLANPRK